jgi:hypothetical protein
MLRTATILITTWLAYAYGITLAAQHAIAVPLAHVTALLSQH